MADRESRHLSDEEKQSLIDRLQTGDRADLRALYADWCANAPTPEAWRSFSAKSPDRWAQAGIIIAKLSGLHTDKLELEHSGLLGFAMKLSQMSDADLNKLDQQRTSEANSNSSSGVSRSLSTPSPKVLALSRQNSDSVTRPMKSTTSNAVDAQSATRSLPMVVEGGAGGGLPVAPDSPGGAGDPTAVVKSEGKVPS